MDHRGQALDSQLFVGIAWFRSAAWIWLVIVAGASASKMTNRPLGWATVVVSGAVTVWLLKRTLTNAPSGAGTAALLADLFMGMGLLVSDGWVYQDGRPQSLAAAWPVAAVLSVGVARGVLPAVLTAVALGIGRAIALVGMVGEPGSWHLSEGLSVLSTVVLYALAGTAMATVSRKLHAAEHEVARAAAREEVARDLHDGILQTLAAFQRRSTDKSLVHMARVQEAQLREYLFDATGPQFRSGGEINGQRTTRRADSPPEPVERSLRRVATEVIARWDLAIDQVYVEPLPTLDSNTTERLAAVVGECLTNVAKHSGTSKANLLVEADSDEVIVTVRDRGVGFDPATVTARGLHLSVQDPLRLIGGSIQITSKPGSGTTMEIRIPSAAITR